MKENWLDMHLNRRGYVRTLKLESYFEQICQIDYRYFVWMD